MNRNRSFKCVRSVACLVDKKGQIDIGFRSLLIAGKRTKHVNDKEMALGRL